MTALISLEESPPVDTRSAWTIYVGDAAPRHVPAAVRARGRYARHVIVFGPFGVQLWWQASDDGDKWYWVEQTG